MNAKLANISNNSAIIVIDEIHAYIVDVDVIEGIRVGEVFEATKNILSQATEYGIDMSIIYTGGIHIDEIEFQKRLYASGIVSLDDLKKNPSAIKSVLISMISTLSVEIYNKIKIVMEDYK